MKPFLEDFCLPELLYDDSQTFSGGLTMTLVFLALRQMRPVESHRLLKS